MNTSLLRQLFSYYYNEYYSTKRTEQDIDLGYYRDIFKVDQLDPLFPVSRTGGGAELINEPVAQLSAAQLSVIRESLKDTQNAQDAALRISKMVNEKWIPSLIRTNPNPVVTFIKNQFLYGEAWLHPVHNDKWVTGKKRREGLPVLFSVPDPQTIYASPNEDERGVPEHTFAYYMRLPWIVKTLYPKWDNPRGKKDSSGDTITSVYLPNRQVPQRFVEWLAYWDGDKRYFEADGQIVLETDNIYGENPFIHKTAGWGTASPDGLPEEIVISRLRRYRDLLKRECNMTTDIDGQFHMFANKSIWVQPKTKQDKIPPDFRKDFRMGSGWLNELPAGLEWGFMESGEPSAQALNYLYALKGELGRKTPGVMSGDALGGSGRLQDIAYSIAFKKYEQQVKNTQYAFEVAFGMALRMCEKIPKLRPDDIKDGDINKDYSIQVLLKPDDPLENERLSSRGSRMWQSQELDLETNLVEFQGRTPEQAKQIKKNIMMERIVFNPNSPFAQILALAVAEKFGMAEQLKALQQMGQTAQMGEAPTATEMQRGQGEVETPMGREMIDQSLLGGEARRSPMPYRRT